LISGCACRPITRHPHVRRGARCDVSCGIAATAMVAWALVGGLYPRCEGALTGRCALPIAIGIAIRSYAAADVDVRYNSLRAWVALALDGAAGSRIRPSDAGRRLHYSAVYSADPVLAAGANVLA
jgi:hypothetical protein